MAEQEQGRNEPATPFRREEARRKGSVAKSLEVNAVVVLLGFLGVVVIAGSSMATKQLALSSKIFNAAPTIMFDAASLPLWLATLFVDALFVFLPMLIVISALAILSNVLQTGAVLSAEPLKPDFSRISPATGLKRVFSVRIIYETVKNLLKIALCVAVAYLALILVVPRLFELSWIDAKAYGKLAIDMFVEIGFKILMILFLIAIIDFFYSRWDYASNLRMSRRELREEIKQREGDPRLKARRRELQREVLKKSNALNKVKDADVLITNPEHYAVALFYERERMSSPQLIAKGSGQLAQSMMKIARRNHVPIFQDKKLARTLFYRIAVDADISQQFYAEVARVLAWAYALKGSRRENRSARNTDA